jgi:hypothetical protein
VLWNSCTGEELARLVAHEGGVAQASFATDGGTLATAGEDATVLLWDTTATRDRARPKGTTLRPAELERLWRELASGDAGTAGQAMAKLEGAGAQGVRYLARQIGEPREVTPARVVRLIEDLGSDRFSTRLKAGTELEEVLDVAEPILNKALAGPRNGTGREGHCSGCGPSSCWSESGQGKPVRC